MGQADTASLIHRIKMDIKSSAESGSRIINRDMDILDTGAIRAAANQFRQAAKYLDELDGILQAIYHERMK